MGTIASLDLETRAQVHEAQVHAAHQEFHGGDSAAAAAAAIVATPPTLLIEPRAEPDLRCKKPQIMMSCHPKMILQSAAAQPQGAAQRIRMQVASRIKCFSNAPFVLSQSLHRLQKQLQPSSIPPFPIAETNLRPAIVPAAEAAQF